MVLSTQTLLLAVGVVGPAQNASLMAGAWNWVVKDGMGQFGGVLFASYVGQWQGRSLDAHPKQWRVAAALALDVANGVEIASPLFAPPLILPLACASNVLKNIGFLTASASRAALHQSLCQPDNNNLADVTAKAGTQAMMAGLMGTAVGIALSTFVLSDDPVNFIWAFCALSLVHQYCNYASLAHVPLRFLNRHRLDLVLSHYMASLAQDTGQVLSPAQVAPLEMNWISFFADQSLPSSSASWLHVGSTVPELAPSGPEEFQQLLDQHPNELYVLRASAVSNAQQHRSDGVLHVTFWEQATTRDVIRGLLHAHLLHHHLQASGAAATDLGACQKEAYKLLQARFESFYEELRAHGWMTEAGVTHVEPHSAARLACPVQEECGQ